MRTETLQTGGPLVRSFERDAALDQGVIGTELAAENNALFQVRRRTFIQLLPANRLVTAHIGRIGEADFELPFEGQLEEPARPFELPLHEVGEYAMAGQVEEAGLAGRLMNLPGQGLALGGIAREGSREIDQRNPFRGAGRFVQDHDDGVSAG